MYGANPQDIIPDQYLSTPEANKKYAIEALKEAALNPSELSQDWVLPTANTLAGDLGSEIVDAVKGAISLPEQPEQRVVDLPDTGWLGWLNDHLVRPVVNGIIEDVGQEGRRQLEMWGSRLSGRPADPGIMTAGGPNSYEQYLWRWNNPAPTFPPLVYQFDYPLIPSEAQKAELAQRIADNGKPMVGPPMTYEAWARANSGAGDIGSIQATVRGGIGTGIAAKLLGPTGVAIAGSSLTNYLSNKRVVSKLGELENTIKSQGSLVKPAYDTSTQFVPPTDIKPPPVAPPPYVPPEVPAWLKEPPSWWNNPPTPIKPPDIPTIPKVDPTVIPGVPSWLVAPSPPRVTFPLPIGAIINAGSSAFGGGSSRMNASSGTAQRAEVRKRKRRKHNATKLNKGRDEARLPKSVLKDRATGLAGSPSQQTGLLTKEKDIGDRK